MQTLLFTLGLVLFLIGLLTGLIVPALKNPRMALSSHLEGVLNGMFLVLLGLLWPHVDLPKALGITAVALIVYSAYTNWLAGCSQRHGAPAAGSRRSRRVTTRPQRQRRDSSAFFWCPSRCRSWSAWASSSSDSDGDLVCM